MSTARHTSAFQTRATRAFTLIEILVAVSLMTVIILGLFAMFSQTQRAMRLGASQVDVMETGRAAMQLLVGELEQVIPFDVPGVSNIITLEAKTTYPDLVQPRQNGDVDRVNILQEIFFLHQENNEWVGTGYFVDAPTVGGAGRLYRFEERLPSTASSNAWQLHDLFLKANRNTAPLIADRVVHLQLHAYDREGFPWTNINNVVVRDYTFTNNILPAYLDLELGVLEPKTYEKYRALLSTPDKAKDYLQRQVARVYVYRQRIPVRTVSVP